MTCYPAGMIQCPECEGRKYVLPSMAIQPGDTGWEDEAKPPRTWWCQNCGARGFVPSEESQAILSMLAAARESGYMDEAAEWVTNVSWPKTG